MAGKLKPGWFWGVDPTALAGRAQKGGLMGRASGNAGSLGVSRLGHPQQHLKSISH